MSIEDTQKCTIGMVVYKVSKQNRTITVTRCVDVYKAELGHYVYKFDNKTSAFSRAFGDTIFFTQADAERCLDRQNKIAHKKALLKKYEEQLNKQLKIFHHNFIK